MGLTEGDTYISDGTIREANLWGSNMINSVVPKHRMCGRGSKVER